MKLQSLCQPPAVAVFLFLMQPALAADAVDTAMPVHAYPTVARVEYVNECVAQNGGKLANLYQCSCAIDRLANTLSYDDFVEASTFAKYATLPGEGGGEFRDPDRAKELAKRFRDLQAQAFRDCGLTH